MYRKIKSAATTKGQQYEYSLIGLILLRIIPWAHTFHLGSNVEGLGKFDDIFLKVMPSDGQRCQILCIQLKHKEKPRKVAKSQLLQERGDFSLIKYYQSYCEIMELKDSDMFCESLADDCIFIIFTNCTVEHLSSNCSPEKLTKLEKLISTSGENEAIFSFSPDDSDIWNLRDEMDDREKYHSFLRRLKFFSGQSNVSGLSRLVEEEISHIANRTLALPFLKILEDWWNNESSFITERSPHFYSLLMKDLNSHLSESLEDIHFRFKTSSCSYFNNRSFVRGTYLNIVVPGVEGDLKCLKIWCDLKANYKERYLVMNASDLQKRKEQVLSVCTRGFCDVLVVNTEDGIDVDQTLLYVNPGSCKVLIVSGKEISSTLRHVEEIWSYDELTEESKRQVLCTAVDFQGMLVRLEALCSSDVVARFFDTRMMGIIFSGGRIHMGSSVPDTQEFFIPRTLRHQTFLREEVLLHVHPKDIFAVSAFPQGHQLPGVLNAVIMSGSHETLPNHKERKLFAEICKVLASVKSVHWVAYEGGGLVWKETAGVRDTPRRYVDRMSSQCVTETECYHRDLLPDDWRERLRLVTGEPGMGKSSLLLHLATSIKRRRPDVWVVHVSLNNFSSTLKKKFPEKLEIEHVLQILYEAACVRNSTCKDLSRVLLRDSLEKTGKIVIMLDAVDEVSPTYMHQVLQIVRLLLQTRVDQLWVTSRTLLQDVLRKELSSLPLILEPFTEKEQLSFLRYHSSQLGAGQAVQIMNLMGKRDGRHICDVPLHALITVDVIKLITPDNDSIKNIGLSHIYEAFLSRKREIYYEKYGINTTQTPVLETVKRENEIFMDNHIKCAVSVLFQDEDLGVLSVKDFDRKFLEELVKEKSGIIERIDDGKAKFIHFTFCEFLAAKWFKKCCEDHLLKALNENSFARRLPATAYNFFGLFKKQNRLRSMLKLLLEAKFEQVRIFLDEMLSDGCKLHQAVLMGNIDRVRTLLNITDVNERDRGGRSALHLAVSHDNVNLVKLLLARRSAVDMADYLLCWRPLQYADRIGSWDTAICLLARGAKDRDMPSLKSEARNKGVWHVIKYVVQNNTHAIKYKRSSSEFQAALDFSLKGGYSELTDLLMIRRDDNNYNYNVVQRYSDDDTYAEYNGIKISAEESPMHNATRYGRIEWLKALLNNYDWYIRDISGNTPLHVAARWNQVEAAKVLLENKNDGDVEARNNSGDTPLHIAARWGHVELTRLLLQHGGGINAIDSNKSTALHLASQSGHVQTTQLLLEHGIHPNAIDSAGQTALHLAASIGHAKCAEVLLQFKANVDIKDAAGRTPLDLVMLGNRMSWMDRYSLT